MQLTNVKIFRNSSAKELEEEINNWLSENVGKIKIKEITQSSGSGSITMISIWYDNRT